jgi:hypothetical protein
MPTRRAQLQSPPCSIIHSNKINISRSLSRREKGGLPLPIPYLFIVGSKE